MASWEGRKTIPAGNLFKIFLLLLKHLRIKIPFREKHKGIQWLFLITDMRHHHDPFKSLSKFFKTKIIYSISWNYLW